MTSSEVPIGAKVSVGAGIGHVRWTGSNPKFSPGNWVGVELLEPTGKNDGSVKGEVYFTCSPNHGVFVRPSQVKVLELPKVQSGTTGKPPPTPSTSRVNNPMATPSSSSAQAPIPQRTTSSRAGPSTPPRAASRTSTQTGSSPGATPRRPPAAPGGTTRPASIFQRPSSAAEPVRQPSTTSTTRTTSPLKQSASSPDEIRSAISPTPTSRVVSPVNVPPIRNEMPPPSSFSSIAPPKLPSRPPSRAASPDKETSMAFAQKRELEELRIKIRILENRKVEDQERIKQLESRVTEADTLRAARVKLQAKFQELQSSLVAAQRLSRDLQSENAHLETKASEAVDQLEMATLDREVAEEKAEASEGEVARMTEKIAELELELAVLREENAEYEKPPIPGEQKSTSLAFVQLEKHNERLKEALIRLRDVSSEAEREHRTKISDLERDLSSQEDLQSRLELSEAKLANVEAQVEDLKLQLDDALGAEDMLEQLTERNLQMGERMEEMRISIEDLEALKELNDELEESHVEAEKHLQEEIDSLTQDLKEESQRSADLESVVSDMEHTIGQFRELVSSLQSEIDALRAQQVTQEYESATFSKESQAVLSLNLKLQSSAVKAQSKTVDLELKRLEAAQLLEHMRIVQAYLPDQYHETEADSTSILLFFHRMSSKLDLLLTVISQIHSLPQALHTATSETLVGVCELRGKLRYFSTLNKRFASIVAKSSVEDWLNFGKVLVEVGGVENKVDGWIGQVKLDEFREGDCARDLGSLIAQFDHLAETTFRRPETDIAERQLGLAYSFDYDLDNFAAAVGFARQAIVSLTSEDDVVVEVGESSLEEAVYEPVQRILDQVRAVKVPSGKLVALLEEITQQSMALLPDLTQALDDLAVSVSNAVDLAVQLAQRIGAHVASLRSSKQPLRLIDVERFLQQITAESSNSSDAPPWELIGMFVSRLGSELGNLLPKIKSVTKAGSLIRLDIPPPWLARVGMIKQAAQYNAETERKVVALSEQLKDMLREIRVRDQTLEESGVKVETLERRLEATRKQADMILELENDVAKAKKQEKVYEEAIEQLQAEQDALEAENARLRKGSNPNDRQANVTSSPALGFEPASIGAGGLEAAQMMEQIDNLKSAIRFLRSENALLKSRDLYQDLHTLPPITYHSYMPTPTSLPELSTSFSTPSSPSSSTSHDDFPVTPTKQSLETESKLLYKKVIEYQSSCRIVDISQLGDGGMTGIDDVGGGAGRTRPHWRSKKFSPEKQIWEWRVEEVKLQKRVEILKERMRGLSAGGGFRRRI